MSPAEIEERIVTLAAQNTALKTIVAMLIAEMDEERRLRLQSALVNFVSSAAQLANRPTPLGAEQSWQGTADGGLDVLKLVERFRQDGYDDWSAG
ncbi:hypothetical protein [Rhizosaccharibacter radicis]|uniref:DUF2281 domain-containing protein n=1 Tax=Rhizosaccharibacter radicis TaxID=2782605 RepID=A0ABT1VW42_9PROT|nr:hypothetical protein [Acetobacteraceae bacterium KSS12]